MPRDGAVRGQHLPPMAGECIHATRDCCDAARGCCPKLSEPLSRCCVVGAKLIGRVAQWLEPTAHNRLVAGSSPAAPTTPFHPPCRLCKANRVIIFFQTVMPHIARRSPAETAQNRLTPHAFQMRPACPFFAGVLHCEVNLRSWLCRVNFKEYTYFCSVEKSKILS